MPLDIAATPVGSEEPRKRTMTRVLLVYHNIDVADIEADGLRRAGYEVDRCEGPVGGGPCPVLQGERCWQVEKADVLVYDTWEHGHGRPDLIGDLRALHPDKPLVLTSPAGFDEVAPGADGEIAAPVIHAPTRAELGDAIERALQAPKVTVTASSLARRATGEPRRTRGSSW
jgi:hypothetical protein